MRHPEIKQLAEFLRTHAPHVAAWPIDRVESWLEWYWLDARMGIIRHKGEILGLVLARCLDKPEQAKFDYFHIEAGRLVWIDAMVSTNAAVLPAMIQQARTRFGERTAFAGHLLKRGSRPTLLPWKRIESLTRHDHQSS